MFMRIGLHVDENSVLATMIFCFLSTHKYALSVYCIYVYTIFSSLDRVIYQYKIIIIYTIYVRFFDEIMFEMS